MPDVDTLFRDYVAEHRSGGTADPSSYLEQLDGDDRRELAALIDGYLTRAPGKAWDADAYAGSPAERVTRSIVAKWDEWELGEEPQPWTELLPALRNRAQVKRRELVERLADAIGFPSEVERVSAYYHQMETGSLPSEGVSNRVLGALGELLGESAERLRAAGSAIGAGEDQAEVTTRVAFARKATQDPDYLVDASASAPAAATPAGPAEDEADEVDRLFTGGPNAAS
jgi:hypothetical protein